MVYNLSLQFSLLPLIVVVDAVIAKGLEPRYVLQVLAMVLVTGDVSLGLLRMA